MTFEVINEIPVVPGAAVHVYQHGWQTWSPTGCFSIDSAPPRPDRAWQQIMRFRPETPAPDGVFQGEGLLIVLPGDGSAVVHVAPAPQVEVASIRATVVAERIVVSADGAVDVRTEHADSDDNALAAALEAVGDGLGAASDARVAAAPTVWCSWYQYFLEVAEADILENLRAIDALELPVDVVQIDDGWEAGIGDWLDLSSRFSSTRALADQIRAAGHRPGLWLAPFIVGADSETARAHPEWLVGDAGWNWDQRLHGLDLTHPGARDYLRRVFTGLREQGFDYVKLDFLYGGAIPGPRHDDCSPVQAYRSGLALVRQALGDDAFVVACGAPVLPSVGLVDAMRVSADTYNPEDLDNGQDVLRGRAALEARAWQQGRLWINDPDCVVARPRFAQRAEWADLAQRWGGLRSFSDRIADLDDWGVRRVRTLLQSGGTADPFETLPGLLP
jgi:alpha-galactosidase